MARIRSVHPGLFTDEAFVSLSSDAQIFLVGLWTECDDQGVFEWKPVTLRMRLRPAKDGPIDAILSELEVAKTIARYELDGRQYGAVRNFRKYQRPKKPNCIHPTTEEIRTYVALNAPSSVLVGNRFGTGGEIPPQMEDGGDNRRKEPSQGKIVSCVRGGLS